VYEGGKTFFMRKSCDTWCTTIGKNTCSANGDNDQPLWMHLRRKNNRCFFWAPRGSKSHNEHANMYHNSSYTIDSQALLYYLSFMLKRSTSQSDSLSEVLGPYNIDRESVHEEPLIQHVQVHSRIRAYVYLVTGWHILVQCLTLKQLRRR
jgi:hypothetical protein